MDPSLAGQTFNCICGRQLKIEAAPTPQISHPAPETRAASDQSPHPAPAPTPPAAPLHAARADLLRRTNQREAAADAYKRALDLCGNSAERAYLKRRLDEMQ